MREQHPILCFLALLLLILASYVSAGHYYIVSDDSRSMCQSYPTGTCFTLAEFDKYFDPDNDITLSFLPGEHLLTERLTIHFTQNITLVGQSSSNNLSTIKCQGTSGFEFKDVHGLKITDLKFTGCGNVFLGGAVSISMVENVLIRGCHFIENHVKGNNLLHQGGAIYAENTVSMRIEGNIFQRNDAAGSLGAGGAITVNGGSVSSSNNQYINNTSFNGGAINVLYGTISSTSNHYSNNSANHGGAIYVFSGKLSSTDDNYISNTRGAIYAYDSNISCRNDYYINNSANFGGAILIWLGNMSSENNHYTNNRAGIRGGAIYVDSCSIHCTSDRYVNNSAVDGGGAIAVTSGNVFSTNDYYSNNSDVTDGGAIYVNTGNISSANDHYINNSAGLTGGAISISFGNIFSRRDRYTHNTANYGGGIYAWSGITKISGDNFEENSAVEGAVIYKTGGKLQIGQSNITDNFANKGSILYANSTSLSFAEGVSFVDNRGSLYVFNTQVDFKGSVAFINNVGDSGGAITAILSQISINTASTLTIRNNTATNGGGISLTQSSLHVYHSIELTDNRATDCGGGIYANQSEIEFRSEKTQTLKSDISNNIASSGGAVCAITSNIQISDTYVEFTSNKANENGGAVYLEQNAKIYIRKNVSEPDHESLHHNNSSFVKKVSLDFTSNSAEKGGAIYVADNTLCQGAITESYQTECFVQTLGFYPKTMFYHNYINTFFTNNTAHQSGSDIYGGLLDRCTINPTAELVNNNPMYKGFDGFDYNKATTQIEQIADYSPRPNLTDYLIRSISRSDVKGLISSDAVRVEFCFDNIISPNYSHLNVSIKKGQTFTVSLVAVDQVGNPLNGTVITSFASESGNGHIKDNQLVRRVGNKCTELEYNVYSYDNSGQLHIHADGPCGDKGVSTKTVSVNFLPCTCPVGFHPYPLDNDCICECDASFLEFCLDNVIAPNYRLPNVLTKKGGLFTVSLVAVNQVESPVNATIISSFSSESGKGHLKDSQVAQQVLDKCTELEYNMYSLDNSAQLHLSWYADTQCGTTLSRKTLNISFLPCTCPVGFQPVSSENNCICECDKRLKQHQITSCFVQNGTILVESNTWIALSNYTNGTGFVIHDCPFDYCVQEPVYISLNSTDSADKKCANNRTGILCGACNEDLSLVFGSSRCKECSDYYIFLLIPFALAGIALVTFILLLNLTVATGTIHGLIFYANILTADHSLFLPFATPNVLTVFISWLNLDLGIETCFYNGMDSYGKFLLQLAFPTYVFILIGTIIVLCEVSPKFATLLSNRNPVATLCTLFLLSYSKLIRTIITALQFTQLDYSDGSHEVVWLYDANVPYFSVSHIPRFIAAFLVVIFGTIYTILLFFGQWFPRCSNRKFMKWTKNTKYNAFIDAYHAPFTPKHRYWIGLLLFAQIIHSIVTAMTKDTPSAILSAGCIALGLILLKLLNTRMYKHRMQDSVETLSLVNLAVLAIATYHIRETNDDQITLVTISMTISFTLFLIILGFHFYKYILEGTRVWARVTKSFQRIKHVPNSHQRHELAPRVEEEEPIIDQDRVSLDSNSQLREPDLDILDPVYTDDYRDPPPSPVVHQPPKITYTVIDGRPGHRDRVPVSCGPAGQSLQEMA